MTEKRYSRMTNHYGTSRTYCTGIYDNKNNRELQNSNQVIMELNALNEENQKLLTLSNMKKGALVEAVKQLEEENRQMKNNGLNVLRFYEYKLKNAKKEDFQSVRGELWIVKQVLYEMGVI